MTSPAANPRRRVAIIGGGIAGLAAAHRVVELDPAAEVVLFEAGPRFGGALRTERRDGFLLEHGADNFITNLPWALDLCRRIGLADQLIETNSARRRALVVRDGRLYPVPEGFLLMEPRAVWPVLTSRLLSWRGKARLLAEALMPTRRDSADESLASFAQRRLGREAYQRLVQPLVAGIYTADPEQLSMAAALPRFLEMERRHGSLIRAVRRARRDEDSVGGGARYSLFVAPREGMQTLVHALAARLPQGAVRTHTAVARIAPRGESGWEITIEGEPAPWCCDAVIVATPAPAAGALTRSFDGELADELQSIPYAGSAIVLLAYREDQLARPPEGFGFVVPDVERRPLLAASFSSLKFPDRAPPGWLLVRTFLGGALRPELVAVPDDELQRIAVGELAALPGATDSPRVSGIARWHGAMPQYHLGHLDRVARIDARVAAWPGLALAGNAYRGVGVPYCVRSGESAAERVLGGVGAGAAASPTEAHGEPRGVS